MNMSKVEVIAFYLPQYHPTPHNDEWWGKGFTEWTNVAKSKPLFRGHYQPKVPADLGFYDLRMAEVREEQVRLAKEAGVSGFCYYHYWFGDGHQELELPFNEVVDSGKPDFPFCLCWANDTWSRKFWNKDGAVVDAKVLAEQKYLGEKDNEKHFYTLLKAFKDPRYYKIDDKPVFMIYSTMDFVDSDKLIKQWNELAIKNGLKGIYFIGYTRFVAKEYSDIKALGFDAVCSCRLNRNMKRGLGWAFRKAYSLLFRIPRKISYKKVFPTLIGEEEKQDDVFPTLIPNWDHTPRSGYNGDLFTGATPALFEEHCKQVFKMIKDKPDNRKIVFLKSWNEWGEGNYMEPDLKYGHGFINALRNAIDSVEW